MIIEVKPIGVIHSPQKEARSPRTGTKSETVCDIELYEEYEPGFKDIDGFSHLVVAYNFHQSRDYSLLVKTPWDDVLHGLFATRSPNRPNSIGICVVSLLSREGRFLTVKGLDAIEGSPLLDIKPYIPDLKQGEEIKLGWLEGKIGLDRGND